MESLERLRRIHWISEAPKLKTGLVEHSFEFKLRRNAVAPPIARGAARNRFVAVKADGVHDLLSRMRPSDGRREV